VSYGARQLRLKVLEEIERLARRFRSDEDMWPVRVPREPLALDDVMRRALPDAWADIDPASLRSRTLLHLTWDDGSAWEVWVMVLPSGLKVFCDTGEDETRILASGGRHANDEAERVFLQRLAESRGERFGIEMSGGPPARVRAAVGDRTFLVDLFVELFEGTEAEQAVRRHLEAAGVEKPRDAEVLGKDFRVDVEHWLNSALPP
jgi:hypothetical protein